MTPGAAGAVRPPPSPTSAMRAFAGLSGAAMLIGCSDPGATAASVDVNAAAMHAEGDIANYAAARKEPTGQKASALMAPPAGAGRPSP